VVSAPGIEALLQQAVARGVQFGLQGRQVRVRGAGRLPAELRAQLEPRRDEIWMHLGGAALDAPPLALLHQLTVELWCPATLDEAAAAFRQLEQDAAEHTADDRCVGLDLETAAQPGIESRPFTKLRRDGGLWKTQPSFTGTAALSPHTARIRLVQLYAGGARAVVLDLDQLPRTGILAWLGVLLAGHTAVVHNASFELRFLTTAGVQVPQYEDTMQSTGLLLGARQRSLEAAAAAYLGVAMTKHLQTSDWSAPELSPGQLAYAAIDAVVALRVWMRQLPELHQKGRIVAYQLQRDVTRIAAAMTARGIALDRARHQQQIDEWRTTLAAAHHRFVDQAKHDPPQTPEQIRAFLRLVLPADVIATWPVTEKAGHLSTKRANLQRAALAVPAMRDLVELLATQTLLKNFGDGLLSKISPVTGRLHPSFNIASAKSGRSSSNDPNAQNVPKRKSPALRASVITAPGYRFIVADYSMMELRAAAEVAGDAVLRQDFADGVDLHRQRAAAMLGIPMAEVSDLQRDHAKAINFGTIYGSGPTKLAETAWNNYGIQLSFDAAAAGRSDFLRRYHVFARWMQSHYQRCSETGVISIGCYGRVIEAAWESKQPGTYSGHASDDDDDDDEGDDDAGYFDEWQQQGWAASALKYTLCCNAPVQGACADICMLAMLLADAAFTAAGIEGGLVIFVHDELVAEVRAEQAEQAAQLLRTAMEQAFTAIFPDAPLTNLVELAIRTTWGKLP
jgi:DNA polymerase I-like protein with 3'-5' exonuclease and polymerase domains